MKATNIVHQAKAFEPLPAFDAFVPLGPVASSQSSNAPEDISLELASTPMLNTKYQSYQNTPSKSGMTCSSKVFNKQAKVPQAPEQEKAEDSTSQSSSKNNNTEKQNYRTPP